MARRNTKTTNGQGDGAIAVEDAPATAAVAERFAVLEIPLDSIKPNPKNPRSKSTMHVEKLAKSIATHGLLHPITVGPPEDDGRYVLLAGRRRLEAFRKLGHTTIPARRLDNGVESPLSILLVENQQREEPDPLLESDVVHELLEREGWTLDSVAETLGKSRTWVHLRANLRTLSEKARDARAPGEIFSDWPAAWLEELALLPADLQDRIVEQQSKPHAQPIGSLRALRQIVQELLTTLAAAPFKLDDPDVAPGCPACTACPKHSLAVPDLFGDGSTPKELRKAHCLDGACFALKAAAFTTAALAKAREKHGDAVVILRGNELPLGHNGLRRDIDYDVDDIVGEVERDQTREDKGSGPLHVNQVREVKKTARNAVPALVVEGVGAGTIKWIADPTKVKPSTKSITGRVSRAGDRPQPKPKSLAEKKKQLGALRQRQVVEEVRTFVEKLEDAKLVRDEEHLLELVDVYGCHLHLTGYEGLRREANAKKSAVKGGKPERTQRIFEGVCSSIAEVLGGRNHWQVKSQPQRYYTAAERVCSLLGLDFGEYVKRAERDRPEPKAWAIEEREAKAKTTGKASKKKIDKLATKLGRKSKPKASKS